MAPGIAFGRNIDHCVELVNQGWRFLYVGSDTGFMDAGVKWSLRKLGR